MKDDSELFDTNESGGQFHAPNDKSFSQCSICKKHYYGIIFVEEEGNHYCFYCHSNKFGIDRFMFVYNKMTKEAQRGGFMKIP